MRLFRQLGSCGTVVLVGPLLWLAACFAARGIAQSGYRQIQPRTREFRVPAARIAPGGVPVGDPHTTTELGKYIQVWELEPGACAEFPERDRWPWSWNPLQASALMLRLKQKQAFLDTQRHLVMRSQEGRRRNYLISPDPLAALGGRSFRVEVEGGRMRKAWELK